MYHIVRSNWGVEQAGGFLKLSGKASIKIGNRKFNKKMKIFKGVNILSKKEEAKQQSKL